MARDERILADAPVVGDQVEIAVADAAMGNGDLHFLRSQFARVITKGKQFCSRCVRCKSLDLRHSLFEFLVGVGGGPAGFQSLPGPQKKTCLFLLGSSFKPPPVLMGRFRIWNPPKTPPADAWPASCADSPFRLTSWAERNGSRALAIDKGKLANVCPPTPACVSGTSRLT